MLLVDAYNVLHVPGILPSHLAGLEVHGLAGLISLSRYGRSRVVLVCDGLPSRSKAGPSGRSAGDLAGAAGHTPSNRRREVEILYAGPVREADSVIEDMLEADSAARRWTVVSSDHRVQKAASHAGARVLDSRVFLRQLATDERRPAPIPNPRDRQSIPLGRADVHLWLREFGIDVHAADHAAAPLSESPGAPACGSATPRPQEPWPPRDGGRPTEHGRPVVPRGGRDVPIRSASPPRPHAPPAFAPGLRPEDIDPVLRELLDGVEGVSIEDLDMRRWLGELPGPPAPGV